MHEAIKIIGGVCWVVGLLALGVSPGVGLVILVVALALTVWSIAKNVQRDRVDRRL